MSKSTIVIIIYIIGLIFGALFLGLWDAETGSKPLIGVIWTTLFLITLFLIEKKKLKLFFFTIIFSKKIIFS